MRGDSLLITWPTYISVERDRDERMERTDDR